MIYRRLAFFSLVFYLVTYLSYSKENEGAGGTTENTEEIYQLPEIKNQPLFLETFQKESMTTNYFNEKEWIKSSEEKYTTQDVAVKSIFTTLGKWNNDQALVLETSHKHYGLVHPLKELFHLNNEKNRYAVLQYEVTLTEGLECGGAYLKLLNEKENKNQQWNQFNDKTGYSIMFGPDKCGSSSKVHLIIRHYDPKRQIYEEKALKDQPAIRNDKLTHLYTLVLDKKENLYEIWIDMEKVKSGSLFQDFEPAFQPLEKIDDPNDKKPKDWVDVKEIPDPNAVKPDDWDENAPRTIVDEDAVKPEDWLDNEPETVSDPSAVKPEDWDDEEDGEWEAPLVPNPKCESASGCGEWKRPNKPNPAYKGKWSAPMIDNPAYKGEWKPRKISNPNYYEVKHPAQIEPINAIAIEIWTITGGIAFDNIWLGYNPDEAKEFAENTWKLKFAEQSEESKLKEQEENDRVRELTLEKGTWLDIMRLRMDDIKEFCNSNPQYAFGIGATILMIVVTAFLMRNKTHTIPSEETDIQQSPDEEVSEEEKEETENDDNKEKQEVKDESTDKQEVEAEEDVNSSEGVRMRKKTPKAD